MLALTLVFGWKSPKLHEREHLLLLCNWKTVDRYKTTLIYSSSVMTLSWPASLWFNVLIGSLYFFNKQSLLKYKITTEGLVKILVFAWWKAVTAAVTSCTHFCPSWDLSVVFLLKKKNKILNGIYTLHRALGSSITHFSSGRAFKELIRCIRFVGRRYNPDTECWSGTSLLLHKQWFYIVVHCWHLYWLHVVNAEAFSWISTEVKLLLKSLQKTWAQRHSYVASSHCTADLKDFKEQILDILQVWDHLLYCFFGTPSVTRGQTWTAEKRKYLRMH